jgi:hypothetical protein
MKNWKTSLFGVLGVVSFVVGYFYPQYREFFTGLTAALVAAGFLSAKDNNVTGGTVTQPTVANPPSIIEKR